MTWESRESINLVSDEKNKKKLSGFGHHTGIYIASEDDDETIDVFNKSENGDISKQFLSPEQMLANLEIDFQLGSLTGLSELIKEVRENILNLESYSIDASVDANSGMAINPTIERGDIEFAVKNRKSFIEKYIKNKVRIKILLEATDELKTEGKLDPEYLNIRKQLKNWQSIIDEILPNLNKSGQLKNLLAAEYKKQVGNHNEEIKRLKKLISGERIEDEKRKKLLKAKVIKVLLGNIDKLHKEEVDDDLMRELWNTASIINDIRIINRLKQKNINLISMKEKIDKKKEEYRLDKNKKEEINKQIIEEIAIPIVNTIREIFRDGEVETAPFFNAAVLYGKEAVCVGLSEVVVSVFKILGFESRISDVVESMFNSSDHAISIVDLIDGTELIIDEDFSSYQNEDLEKKEKKNDWPTFIKEKIEQNRKLMNKKSLIFLYTAKRIDEDKINTSESNQFRIIDQNGKSLPYESNIPHPHKIITKEANSEMSSAVRSNYALQLRNHYKNFGISKEEAMLRAEYQYIEALKINPGNAILLADYALFLKENGRINEAIFFSEKSLQIYPNSSRNNFNHAVFMKKLNRKEEASLAYKKVIQLMERESIDDWSSRKEEILEKIKRLTED